MPASILNLPDYKVVRVQEDAHDYQITAEVSNQRGACVGCGSERLIGHGRNEQVIRDMPTHGKRVAVYVETRLPALYFAIPPMGGEDDALP